MRDCAMTNGERYNEFGMCENNVPARLYYYKYRRGTAKVAL
jgi:hypothetical protein